MSMQATSGVSSTRLARIGEELQARYLRPGLLPGGQLRIARRGEVVLDQCFGMMDVARGKPWASDAIVRIFSMTKPVVSVALMMLWERGLFQLDQPVGDILPTWRDQRVWVSGEGASMVTEPAARPVTFRHLLTHTGGVTYGARLASVGGARTADPVGLAYAEAQVDVLGEAEGLGAFAAKVGELPLRYQPGARWMYSYSTDIVGALIEELSGRPLDRFLEEEIFAPLGMNDTGFSVRQDAAGRLAACYMVTPQYPLSLADDPLDSARLTPPRFLSGGGGLVSTMADYHRFAELLRRGGELDGARLLSPRTVRLMTRNHLPGGRDLTELALISDPKLIPGGMGFGLGFGLTTDAVRAGLAADGDFYWSGAANTIWWVDPAAELSVIFLTQVLPTTAYRLQDWLKALVYAAI